LDTQRELAFVIEITAVKEVTRAPARGRHDGERLCARCFDAAMNVCENIAGNVAASLTTVLRSVPSKAWTSGLAMADPPLNQRMTSA